MQLSCLLIVALAVVSVTPAPQILVHKTIPLLARSEQIDDFGQFALSYVTGDGLRVTDQGFLKPGPEGLVLARTGTFSYTSPEGELISTSYIADEMGARFEGGHLPVSVMPIH